MQRVLKVIPGRNTQAARQFNYAPLCTLIPPLAPPPKERVAVVVGGVGAIREQGISTCRNICLNIAENFSVRS